ncbi:electron transfer flavoprotein subunit beta [Photobacterium jeanii]|uniref:Electron transfer flavoprotein subunit alpha n=1 Tax=Photobacterium jeanii TaxID=858640 RepID=A0A178K833_9GAMM|nr:FAD-binding protein [Photobacterium jeanii]OAN13135.1 electron transfer flavoprotein subunit beta [Photobacterium jeanii]PST89287.1 electron transfer flavoprotein subunit alpha [Photobacterium jeanii]
MKTLVIAEHDGHTLAVETLKTINAAVQLSQPIELLLAGEKPGEIVNYAQQIAGVERVLVADNACYQHLLAENLGALCHDVIASGEYSHVMAAATTFGKNLLPRLAALLDVGMLSDVIELVSADTVIRPIYAGNALARVKSNDSIKVISVRASAFNTVEVQGAKSAEIVELNMVHNLGLAQFVSQETVESARPDLPAARVVVSGGRGLGSKENFAMVEQLADKLGAAIGASRAAVDAGYVSNDLQVGQTGKIVAPDLYIAVGISGAIQHLAGMKDSKVIVAINKDPDAAIFEVADYGLVGDLFEILPELIEQLDG